MAYSKEQDGRKEPDARILIDELENDLDRVRRLHSSILTLSTLDINNEAREELEQLMSTVKTASFVLRGSILDIEQAVSEKITRDVDSQSSKNIAKRLKKGQSRFTVDEVEKLIKDGKVDTLTQGISDECEELRRIFSEMENNPKGPDLAKIAKCMKVASRHQMLIDKANATLGLSPSTSQNQGPRPGHSRQQSQGIIGIQEISGRLSESRINMYKSRDKIYQSQVFKSKQKQGYRIRGERIRLCIQLVLAIVIFVALMFLVTVFLNWAMNVPSGPWFQSRHQSNVTRKT